MHSGGQSGITCAFSTHTDIIGHTCGKTRHNIEGVGKGKGVGSIARSEWYTVILKYVSCLFGERVPGDDSTVNGYISQVEVVDRRTDILYQ